MRLTKKEWAKKVQEQSNGKVVIKVLPDFPFWAIGTVFLLVAFLLGWHLSYRFNPPRVQVETKFVPLEVPTGISQEHFQKCERLLQLVRASTGNSAPFEGDWSDHQKAGEYTAFKVLSYWLSNPDGANKYEDSMRQYLNDSLCDELYGAKKTH